MPMKYCGRREPHGNTRRRPLRVLIVGAGLGGLACAIGCRREGLEVTVLEQASELSEIGAGIQVPPNASRVMAGLDLLDRLISEGDAETIEGHHYVHYADGKTIISRLGATWMKQQYGYAWHVIHRADYLRVLVEEAKLQEVDIRLDWRVVRIDCSTPYAESEHGERIYADVIIGADGLNSAVRGDILGRKVSPQETGDLAFRATVPRRVVEALGEPTLDGMLQRHEARIWWGHNSHAVLYPVRHGSTFNVVLVVPDDLPPDTNKIPASIDQMRKLFEGWDPVLTRLIAQVPYSLKWKMSTFTDSLETWNRDCVTLLGDACHPTLPYQAQGAAMAVEDGACIAKLLGLASNVYPVDIPAILQLYEQLRKTRTTLNVQGAAENREMYHAVGEAAEKRNALLQDYNWDDDPRPTPLLFNDRQYQHDMMGFDVVGDAVAAFAREFGHVSTEGVDNSADTSNYA